jgi:hypothetical protein
MRHNPGRPKVVRTSQYSSHLTSLWVHLLNIRWKICEFEEKKESYRGTNPAKISKTGEEEAEVNFVPESTKKVRGLASLAAGLYRLCRHSTKLKCTHHKLYPPVSMTLAPDTPIPIPKLRLAVSCCPILYRFSHFLRRRNFCLGFFSL